jgi:transposase-like protein
MASALQDPRFHDEEKAFEALEAIMWPKGRPDACPHCGNAEPAKMNKLAVQRSKPSKKHPEGKPVYGTWKCYACKTKFTVRKGTIFEDSPLELRLWFQAAFLMCSSKKGCSANQLHRTLGITLKSAWFMAHRLREAMREGPLAAPFGSGGGAVEADETYIGRWRRLRDGERGHHHKIPVFTLIDRETKRARSVVMPIVTSIAVGEIVAANVSREAHLKTDEAIYYKRPGSGIEISRLDFCNERRSWGQRAFVLFGYRHSRMPCCRLKEWPQEFACHVRDA